MQLLQKGAPPHGTCITQQYMLPSQMPTTNHQSKNEQTKSLTRGRGTTGAAEKDTARGTMPEPKGPCKAMTATGWQAAMPMSMGVCHFASR